MTAFHTFDEAIAHSAQFKKRHLLLGNGFSIACRPQIFTYVSLFEQADFSSAPRLPAVFEPDEEAELSIITFAASGFEQRWNAGDATLLETAEAHGLSPAFSCRDGKCGSCATKIKSGAVAYRTKPTAVMAEDKVLLCCSVPAKGSDVVELDL